MNLWLLIKFPNILVERKTKGRRLKYLITRTLFCSITEIDSHAVALIFY